jgi:hypothetical protein
MASLMASAASSAPRSPRAARSASKGEHGAEGRDRRGVGKDADLDALLAAEGFSDLGDDIAVDVERRALHRGNEDRAMLDPARDHDCGTRAELVRA